MEVIVLINQNLNLTVLKNYELNFENKNFNLEFWCLLPLYRKKLFKKFYDSNYGIISHPKFKYITTYRQLFNLIVQIKKKTIVLDLAGTVQSSIIELLMVYKGCEKITRFNNTIIKSKNSENFLQDFNNILKFGYKFLIKKILYTMKVKYRSFLVKAISKKPKFYFVPNQRSYDFIKSINSNADIIKYNSSDFNYFQRLKPLKSKKNFIVYIDQEFERSFESIILENEHKVIDRDKYWSCLDCIFKKFEKKLKLNLKIAAHFRRAKDSLPNINRKFFFYQTPELIKNSKLVIGSGSLALNYAVLFRKPIILLNFEVFDSISLMNRQEINKLHKELNLKIININKNYEFKIEKKIFKNTFNVNEKKYYEFENYYINFKNSKDVYKNLWFAILKSRIN